MSMRRRSGTKQSSLWVATSELAASPGHPFYERLNAVLREAGFDRHLLKPVDIGPLQEAMASAARGQ